MSWSLTTQSSFGRHFDSTSPTSTRPCIGKSPRRIAMALPAGSDKNRGTDHSDHLFSSAPPVLLRTNEVRDDDTRGWVNTGVSPTNSPRPRPAAANTFDDSGYRMAQVRWQKAGAAMKAISAFTSGARGTGAVDGVDAFQLPPGALRTPSPPAVAHKKSQPFAPPITLLHVAPLSAPSSPRSPRRPQTVPARLSDARRALPPPRQTQRREFGQAANRPFGYVPQACRSPRDARAEYHALALGNYELTPRYTWEPGYVPKGHRR